VQSEPYRESPIDSISAENGQSESIIQQGPKFDPRLPKNLKEGVLEVVKGNCTDAIQALLLKLQEIGKGNYYSLDIEALFGRIYLIEINPKQAPPKRVGSGASSGIINGKRFIWFSTHFQNQNISANFAWYVNLIINELLHHAKEKGGYTDKQLDQAAEKLMTPEVYKEAKKNARTEGDIAHKYINQFCNYTQEEVDKGIPLALNP
jgi:hypothetical protein